LRFIRRARDLGLSMERIKLLVGLWHDRKRPIREVSASPWRTSRSSTPRFRNCHRCVRLSRNLPPPAMATRMPDPA
jgi:DNA-binding transcriptional MerR regulator